MSGFVYVSHSWQDGEYVHRLVAHLTLAGFDVRAEPGADPAARWWPMARDEIDGCAAFVAVLSPAAQDSRWVEREVHRALDGRVAMAALLLAGKPYPPFEPLPYADVTDGSLPGGEFVARLHTLLGRDRPEGHARPTVRGESRLLLPAGEQAAPVRAMQASPTEDLLAIADSRAGVAIVDLTSGAVLRHLDYTLPALSTMDRILSGRAQAAARVETLAWSPDGTRVLAGNADPHFSAEQVRASVGIWDLNEDTFKLIEIERPVVDVAWAPTGDHFALVRHDGAFAYRVPAPAGRAQRVASPALVSAAWSPDGTRLAGAWRQDGRVHAGIWHEPTGAQLRAVPIGDQPADVRSRLCLDWARSGGLLAVTAGPQARLWHVETGAELGALHGHAQDVEAVRFSPDGAYLATAGQDQTVRIWRSASGEQQGMLLGHTAPVTALSWSHDGSLLVSAGADGVRVWALTYP